MKKNISVMHRVLGGWSFYPIVYKDKKYVIIIRGTKFFYYNVKFYEYKEKKSFFRNHKGRKIHSTAYSIFEYEPDTKTCTESGISTCIFSEDFMSNYPAILKNILEHSEKEIENQKAQKEIIKKNAEWDGVIR